MSNTDKDVKTKRAHTSRRRGKRGEYMLRDFLRSLGWEAERVPTSGAAKGFPGDIKAARDGKTLLLECKNYSGTFNKIYELYNEHVKTRQDDLLSFVAIGEARVCVDVSTSLDAVLEGPTCHEFVDRHPLGTKYKRTFQKIGNMQKLVQECDVLCLKDDRRPWLFVRYR